MNQPHKVAASVRQRLKNLATKRGEDFQSLLTRYALERFLYRLSQSQYCDTFILKGALLFSIWSNEPHRATRDIDLLGYGDNTLFHLEQVWRHVCQIPVDLDGLEFREDTVKSLGLKKDQEYEGVRINLRAFLAGTSTRIELQIDIGFGDAVTPTPPYLELPTILDFPAFRLRTYPRETVVAEKFQAMVMLGMANSRMKDFYDLWFLAMNFEFEGETLCQAIEATFSRRRTPLPKETPLALTPEFFESAAKLIQWKAFLNKGKLETDRSTFSSVIAMLQNFLMPPCRAFAKGETFSKIWRPAGLWQQVEGGRQQQT